MIVTWWQSRPKSVGSFSQDAAPVKTIYPSAGIGVDSRALDW